MYKKYVESLKAQSGTLYIENVTQFTNQPLELNAGEWEADDLGIHKKNGFNDEISPRNASACGCPPWSWMTRKIRMNCRCSVEHEERAWNTGSTAHNPCAARL